MSFSPPSIRCSAGPPSLRLLPNSVRCLNSAQRFDHRALGSSRKLSAELWILESACYWKAQWELYDCQNFNFVNLTLFACAKAAPRAMRDRRFLWQHMCQESYWSGILGLWWVVTSPKCTMKQNRTARDLCNWLWWFLKSAYIFKRALYNCAS